MSWPVLSRCVRDHSRKDDLCASYVVVAFSLRKRDGPTETVLKNHARTTSRLSPSRAFASGVSFPWSEFFSARGIAHVARGRNRMVLVPAIKQQNKDHRYPGHGRITVGA